MENKDKLKCKVIILVCSTTSPIIKSSINLYFISEREIKARDYVMLPDRKGVKFMNYSDILNYLESESFATKKIEASTDPYLNLPLIPQSFIEKYVEKQGKIDEVMIELCDRLLYDTPHVSGIKVRPDNTVIVSRNEVEIKEC